MSGGHSLPSGCDETAEPVDGGGAQVSETVTYPP